MTSEIPDPDLTRLFESERLDAEASAPDLDELLARPRRRPRPGAIRLVALSAALVALAAAALLVRTASRPGRARESADASPASVQLADWKAPTDILLATPGSDLWTRVPTLAPRVPAPRTGVFLEVTKGVEP
jgi:hypothetical protein